MLKTLVPIGIMICCLYSSHTFGQTPDADRSNQTNLISLAVSITPLIDHFNSGKGKSRFVALLSSTCPACVFGARAIKASVLDAYPEADIQVSIVWIDMLPSDNEEAAIKSSSIFDDSRVKQFYDPDRKSGYAIGKDLLNENVGPAWDIYLYYKAEAEWKSKPPKPIEWMHQLGGGRRADASQFTPGQALVKALSNATAKILKVIPIETVIAVESQEGELPNEGSNINGRVFRIKGMDCQKCANLIGSTLSKLKGVTEAGASFEQGLAWVGFDENNTIDDIKLIKAITDIGFEASLVENAIIRTGESSKANAKKRETNMTQVSKDNQANLQLLVFPGCPNSPELHTRLTKALADLGVILEIKLIDLQQLDKADLRLRYGAPTILINGLDLMGQSPAAQGALQCRIYPDGDLPSVADLVKQLQIHTKLPQEN